jgi:hypothetical protein
MTTAIHYLSLAAPAAPPSEFRIFKAGINSTTKGPFLFDEAAAREVMARYQQEGVDLIVDLEHASLDPNAPHYDPDARGHFKLALRNGELWAVDCKWTPDGQRRLAEKTQRYISPVAWRDEETKRVVYVANVGLVAQPATHHAPPLVAASKFGAKTSTMLGARVGKVEARRFRALAKQQGMAPGVLLRGFIMLAAAKLEGKTPGQIMAMVGDLLGLEDTSPEFVLEAVKSIYAEIPPVGDGSGTTETADPAPPPLGVEPQPLAKKSDPLAAKLSRTELAHCEAKSITPSQFYARKQLSARRAPAKPTPKPRARKPLTVATLSREQWDQIRKAKMRPEEFVTRFNALKR